MSQAILKGNVAKGQVTDPSELVMVLTHDLEVALAALVKRSSKQNN